MKEPIAGIRCRDLTWAFTLSYKVTDPEGSWKDKLPYPWIPQSLLKSLDLALPLEMTVLPRPLHLTSSCSMTPDIHCLQSEYNVAVKQPL